MRLTRHHRDALRVILIEARFNPEAAKLRDEEADLADRLYDALYSKGQQKKIRDLPKGWLREDYQIEVVVMNSTHHFRFSDNSEKVFRRFLSKDFNAGDARVNLKDGDPLISEVAKLVRRRENLRDERRTVYNETGAMLDKFHTLKKLLEGWPEVRPHIPKEWFDSQNVPMIPTQDLNRKLGLGKAA